MPDPRQFELNEIAEELVRLRLGDARDDLRVQRYKRRAEALVHSHPGKAHNILGTIAAIRRDEVAMRDHFRIARLNDPWDPAVRVNFVSALQEFACLSEAAREATANCADLPRNPELLRQAVEACVFAGRLREAATRLNSLDRFHMQRSVSGVDGLIRCAGFLERQGVEDAVTEERQKQAARLLRSRDVSVPQVRIALEGNGDQTHVTLALVLRRSETEVKSLQRLLGESDPGATVAPERVRVTFMTREAVERIAAND
ncbi:MAG: hypothetical protein HQL82_09835 [Magnetococcales bacterium]|nr:hypothetical protein [Magnetococcales bacterium]